MATNTSNGACQNITRLVDQLRQGKSIFSTKLGQWAPRLAESPLSPIILRTDPMEDMHALVASLRGEFPKECKQIFAPIRNIYDYFDHQDVHMHGLVFIQTVLCQIAAENAERASKIEKFAQRWMEVNIDRFSNIEPDTQEIYDETEKAQYHECFLHDALELLKAYKVNPPASKQSSSELPRSIGIASAGPLTPFEPRPSDYRSLVTASRVPSGLNSAQSAVTDPTAIQGVAGQRQHRTGFSPPQDHPLTVPGPQPQADEPKSSNVPESSQQPNPAETLENLEGLGMDHRFNNQIPSMTGNTGSRPGIVAASTVGQPAPNPTRSDNYRPRGKSVTYYGKRSAGPQYASNVNDSRISSPQFPYQNNLANAARNISDGNCGPLVQVPSGLQGVMPQFPAYSLEPLPEMSQEPPILQSSSTPLQAGYPQRSPSFGQAANTHSSAENQYQGYHFRNVELPNFGIRSQAKGRRSSFTGSNQASPQQPASYAGNCQSYARPQGQFRQNPRKGFSDDARNLPRQETTGQREFSGESDRSRRSSSGSTYDSQGPGQTGWQRGHQRQHGSCRGGLRRPSSNQHLETERDGVPIEGGFSHMGYFGGGGGSGDFGHLVHQTIKEDLSDGSHRVLSNQEAAKTGSDASVVNHLQHEVKYIPAGDLPIHDPDPQPTRVYSYQQNAPHRDPATSRRQESQPAVTPMGLVPHHEPFRGSANPSGVRNTVYTRTYVPRLDPLKVFVSGEGLTSVQVERLFAPHGTIVRLAGPYPPNQNLANTPRKNNHFYVTYSNPMEAQSALQRVQNLPLSANNRLTVLPGLHQQHEGSSMNRYWTAAEPPSQTYGDAAGRAQKDFRGPTNTQEPGPSHHDFHYNQTNTYNEGFGRARRYSERRQDAEGGENSARQPRDTQSPPKTPKKYKKGKKGKAKASSPTTHSETDTQPSQSQKGEREGGAKYDGRHQSSDINMIPSERRSRSVTQGGTEQQMPTTDSQQDTQTNVSNKETKWKRDFSEPRPVSLADMILSSSKKRDSPKKAESRSAQTPQLTSDGSPSRKSRPAPRKPTPPDMNLEQQTPGSDKETKRKPAEVASDEWPALQKIETASKDQQDRKEHSTVLLGSTPSRALGQRPGPAPKEEAPTATASEELSKGRQWTSSGSEHLHISVDNRVVEQTESVPMSNLFPLEEAETATDGHAQEKEAADAKLTADADEPRPETQAMAERGQSPCISPKTAEFLSVTNTPWDPCQLASGSKAEFPVETDEKAKADHGNPPDNAYPDVRDSPSTDVVPRMHPPSITQTERSESWADLSEKNEPSSLHKHRNWRGDLSSATSMADPESRRSSSLTRLHKPGPIGEGKGELSPSKDVPTVDTFTSASSSGVNSGQGQNAKRFRPSRRGAELNSFDYWRADIEAHEKEASPAQDSKFETDPSRKQLGDSSRGCKDSHVAAGPSTSAEASTTAWTDSGSLEGKGKGKELTIDIPPRSPTQNTVIASHSKSPKSGKKKERFEPVLGSGSLSVPVGPIATHMKKKNKPSTPTKPTSRKKGSVNKQKESKVQGPSTPAKAESTELNDAMTPTEPELDTTPEDIEVKPSSDAILQSEAAETSHRTPTPYASGSFKDIVQDDVVLPCIAQKESRDREDAFSPGTTEFQRSFLRLISDRTGQNIDILSFGNQGAGFKEDDPSEQSSSDNQDTDSTMDDITGSKDGATTAETAQEESAKARRAKNRNKTRRGKGKGKSKKRKSSTSDTTAALPRPAEFPTLPLNSPGSSLGGGVDEQKMFPPLAIVPPSSEGGSEFTESWLRRVKSEHEAHSKDSPRVDANAVLRAFDDQRAEYEDFKGSYGTERAKKFDRLINRDPWKDRGGFGLDTLRDRGGLGLDPLMSHGGLKLAPLTNRGGLGLAPLTSLGGLGIDLGSGSAPKNGDVLGKSLENRMPLTPATPTLQFSKLLSERGAMSPSGKEKARPESPPLGGPSTPPPLTDQQAATMAHLTAERADRVLQLLEKDSVAADNVHPPAHLLEDNGEADSAPRSVTPASSECSTEIDLALQERSTSAAKSPEDAVANVDEVPSPSPVTSVETGFAAVDLPAPVLEVESSAKLEDSAELQSSSEIHTPRPLSSALTADLAQENITALRKNGEIILIFPQDRKDEADAPSDGPPGKSSSPPPEPLTPSVDLTEVKAPTPSSAEAMPPPMRPETSTSTTDSDFPSLPAAKPPSFETSSPSKLNLSLSLPHRRSSARSKLSEANIAALESTAPPPPHQGRHRGESIKSTSEFSTTSSVRRKLFSEAAASPGVNSPRRPEGQVGGGGQSLQSFVGAPVLFSGSSPSSSQAQTSATSSGGAVQPLATGSVSSTVVAAPESPSASHFPSPCPSPTLSSPRTLTAVPTLSPFPAGTSSSATLPLPPPSSFVAGRRRGAKRRRIPEFWIS